MKVNLVLKCFCLNNILTAFLCNSVFDLILWQMYLVVPYRLGKAIDHILSETCSQLSKVVSAKVKKYLVVEQPRLDLVTNHFPFPIRGYRISPKILRTWARIPLTVLEKISSSYKIHLLWKKTE